jgi:thiamine-monophosphate kinase
VSEAAFLERLRSILPAAPAGEVWIGDDAAVLAGGLLLCTDVLAEGVHFDLAWSGAADAGWKALAVNCSDVAAMGGTPRAAVAAVVVPPDRPGLADALSAGLMEAAAAFGCPLVGGDTVAGPTLVLTVSVVGTAPASGAVLRGGARPGDTVMVTGPLGGPRAALEVTRSGRTPDPDGLRRLRRPVPRLDLGRLAAEAGATAMIDLSDGLSTDLAHVCRASGVGARIEADAVPVGPGATLEDALAGGDDYELCLTLPEPDRLAEACAAAGLPAPMPIGVVVEGAQLLLAGPAGEQPLTPLGWEHTVP